MPDYRNSAASSYRFPSDLLDSPEYGHMVQFSAYTPQSFVQAAGANYGLTSGRQMLDSFQLYMPGGGQSNNLSFQQGHEYDEIKLARLGAGVASAVIGVGSDLISGANALAGGMFRRQINPGVEVLYRSTELREFQFFFLMSPKSQKESDSIKSIVMNMRKYAAPKITPGTGGVLFNTPAEWEIKFYNKGQENTNIPKIRNCVLTDIFVDYTQIGRAHV